MSDLQIPLPLAVQQRALVPAWLVAVAVALVPVLSGANAFLPDPWATYAGVACFVSAMLSGVAMPQLRFRAPLIPLALVPGAMALSGLLGTFAQSHPNVWVHFLGMLVSGLLTMLAGKTLPQPTR